MRRCLALLTLVACDASEPEAPAAWLELGTGLAEFAALDDGDPIELVAGPQGGWHVDVALRFGGFGPDGVELLYQGFGDSSGELLSFPTQASLSERQVRPFEDGWERLGDRIIFDIDSPADVVGLDVRLEVTATADEARSDSRIVRVVDENP